MGARRHRRRRVRRRHHVDRPERRSNDRRRPRPQPRRPTPPPAVTPPPLAAGRPGPNGGVVVRWFVGLGTGAQPAAAPGQRRSSSTTFNASQKDVYLALEIYDNNVAAQQAQDPDRGRQRAGHHRAGRRRGPEPLPRQPARPGAAHRQDQLQRAGRRSQARRLLQARRGRRDDRRPVRRLSVVHLLQQGPVRRGQAAVSADQGRRPVRGQAVGHGRRPHPRHEADRRQERQRRHERRASIPTNIVQWGFDMQYADNSPLAESTLFGPGSFVAADGKTAQIPANVSTGEKWYNDGVWKDHFIPTRRADQQRPARQGQRVRVGQPGHERVATPGSRAASTRPRRPSPSSSSSGAPSRRPTTASTTAKLHADTFSMLNTTKHPDEAFKALTALVASPELLTLYGAMPADPAQQDAFFKSIDKNFPDSSSTGPSRRPCWPSRTSPTTSPGSPTTPSPRPPGRPSRTSTGPRPGSTSMPSSTTLKTTLQGIFDEPAS